ncbi:extensin family protein [Alterisphingorhabdus coralli]|uniref:Extensin family protein n=1 Tax=Alterisphingorhabdus coralli TaxID=3071408 RepID=A0AA97F6K1_9SPHN|nr:extensin family protein [Parasphingorhabdus sp. SCSIO 66989]WOE74213.1 extensin family protein [Parasphingorhabdus sp. SCSIO 66989]
MAVLLLMLLLAAIFLRERFKQYPQDFPWTDFSLADQVGLFTPAKLAKLGAAKELCFAELDGVGISYTPMETKGEGPCLVSDAVRPDVSEALAIRYTPDGVAPSCPMVSGLVLWEEHVVQQAAAKHFGADVYVIAITHIGSYNCRRINGANSDKWSQHSTADALDIAGFTLSNGVAVSVLEDWDGEADKAAFLRDVRDGACDIFTTTLSPDYNAAHANHFHLDLADRGMFMPSLCR